MFFKARKKLQESILVVISCYGKRVRRENQEFTASV